MKMERPTFKDVLEARSIIKNYLFRTPLYSYPQLNQLLDAKVYIKHENYMPTCAFKVRGGINLIYHLTCEQKERGVVTASTGNHALSIAHAANLFWKAKKIVKDKMETAAEGLATQIGYEFTQGILQDFLTDFILVSEEEMVQAILIYMELIRNLAEEASSSPLAAALKIKERLKGKKVALVLTGSNISMDRLKQIL